MELVGDLFALPDSAISETFQPIFSEFLKRLTDRVVEVRMSVLEHVKSCLLSNPSRSEAPQIICMDFNLDFIFTQLLIGTSFKVFMFEYVSCALRPAFGLR